MGKGENLTHKVKLVLQNMKTASKLSGYQDLFLYIMISEVEVPVSKFHFDDSSLVLQEFGHLHQELNYPTTWKNRSRLKRKFKSER